MIVRKRNDEYIFIEQHHHGEISANIIEQLQELLLRDDRYKASVLYAIENHDIGWKLIDVTPFWNDATHTPYTFVDFPIPSKIVIYTYGVDQVEKVDPYAAALCSAHFSKFLEPFHDKEVQQFLTFEKIRRKRILTSFKKVTEEMFSRHLSILQFADNLSLFICLHEYATYEKEKHPFFLKGVPVPKHFPLFNQSDLIAKWADEHTLIIPNFPNNCTLQLTACEKVIHQDAITTNGLVKEYSDAPLIKRTINVQGE